MSFPQEGLRYKIEIIVNNAGIIGPKGNFEDLNWDQWKYALEINFLGSAYLVKKLIPQFKKNNFGRIIQIKDDSSKKRHLIN